MNNRYFHKNWELMISTGVTGKVRARVYIVNKRDFIFRLRTLNTPPIAGRESRAYHGRAVSLERFGSFASRFGLVANIHEIAYTLLERAWAIDPSGIRSLDMRGNPLELDFCINDEAGFFASDFPRESDVLMLCCSGLRREEAEPGMLGIMTETLDLLAENGVIEI